MKSVTMADYNGIEIPEKVYLVTGRLWGIRDLILRLGFSLPPHSVCIYIGGGLLCATTLDESLYRFVYRRSNELPEDESDRYHPMYPFWNETWDTLSAYNAYKMSIIKTLSFKIDDNVLNFNKLREYGLMDKHETPVWRLVLNPSFADTDEMAYVLRHWGFSKDLKTSDWVASDANEEFFWFLSRRASAIPMAQEDEAMRLKYGERWHNLPEHYKRRLTSCHYGASEVKAR